MSEHAAIPAFDDRERTVALGVASVRFEIEGSPSEYALVAVDTALERLGTVTQSLRQRLAPVLREASPISEARLASPDSGAPLPDMVAAQSRRLDGYCDELVVLLERLAL